MATCKTPDSDILIVPAGESVEFFPLNRVDADLAFVCDSWDSIQLFIVEPQLPPATVIGDEVITKLLQERFKSGPIDQSRLQYIQAEISRISKIPLEQVKSDLALVDRIRQQGGQVLITSAMRSPPTQTRQTSANVKQRRQKNQSATIRVQGGTRTTSYTSGGMFKVTTVKGGKIKKN